MICQAEEYAYLKFYSNCHTASQKAIDFTFLLKAPFGHPAPFLLRTFVHAVPSYWDACPFLIFQISVQALLGEPSPTVIKFHHSVSPNILSIRPSLPLSVPGSVF